MEGGGGQIPKASKIELEFWAGSLTIEALITDLPSVSYPVALTKALLCCSFLTLRKELGPVDLECRAILLSCDSMK